MSLELERAVISDEILKLSTSSRKPFCRQQVGYERDEAWHSKWLRNELSDELKSAVSEAGYDDANIFDDGTN